MSRLSTPLTRETKRRIRRDPLAWAIGALAVGVLVGVLIPTGPATRRLIRETGTGLGRGARLAAAAAGASLRAAQAATDSIRGRASSASGAPSVH